jgi:hypothetical protein
MKLYFPPFQKPSPCLQVLHLCCATSILFIFGLCVCNFVTSFCSQICVLLFSLCVILIIISFFVLGKLSIDLQWQNKLKLCYWNIIFNDHASPYSNRNKNAIVVSKFCSIKKESLLMCQCNNPIIILVCHGGLAMSIALAQDSRLKSSMLMRKQNLWKKKKKKTMNFLRNVKILGHHLFLGSKCYEGRIKR